MSDLEAGADSDDTAVDDTAVDDVVDSGNRADLGRPQAVLEYLAKSIVDDPDGVTIDADERANSIVLRLHVASDDMGKVIGKRGRVAQAIRTVVRAAGAKDGIDANVDIVD